MDNIKNNKKLNRKGFTLIELLAVIVILAVIMVIASTSVLSAMNSSRKKSLLDSAASAKDAFDTAYAELTLTNETSILGIQAYTESTTGKGLLTGNYMKLTSETQEKLDITSADYNFDKSFVYFDTEKSTFLVCLVASQTGNFYVGAAAGKPSTTYTDINYAKWPTGGAEIIATGNTISSPDSNDMWACSNGKHSWTD